MANTDLESLFDMYLQSLMLRAQAEDTLKSAKDNMKCFFRYLRKQGINDISRVKEETINGYMVYLYDYRKKNNDPLAIRTIIYRLSGLKYFYRYLIRTGIVKIDPTTKIERPKEEDSIPRVIMTQEETKRLLKAPDWRTAIGYRDRTIMEILYSSALRNLELRSLRVEDINLVKGLICVNKGKGGKTGVVPVGKIACRFLRSYIEKIRPQFLSIADKGYIGNQVEAGTQPQDNSYLFLNEHGRMLGKGALSKIIKKYYKAIGIKKQITAHCFRHSAATHLLEQNMDIRYIQEFLRHEKIDSTQIYARVVINDLKEKYKQHHLFEKQKSYEAPHWKENKKIRMMLPEGRGNNRK